MTNQNGQFRIPNGIIFIFDPEKIVEIPGDTGLGPVLNTDDCVSVWTLHEDDGVTDLTITDDLNCVDGDLKFFGMLPVKNGRLAIHDSSLTELVGLEVRSGSKEIRVFSNDDRFPSRVVCLVAK